jgi:hypothetical protein
MGARDELTAELAAAFDADLADAVRPLTYVSTDLAGGVYDPSTSTLTGRSDRSVSTRGVVSQANASSATPPQEWYDVEALIIAAELSVTPKVGDTFIDPNLGKIEVVGFALDPFSAVWTLKGRKAH